jgi:NADPH-dependent F420 reductase
VLTPCWQAGGVTVGLLGGTGSEGRGLARRFALAGHDVVIGSRDAARAAETATTLAAECGGRGGRVSGAINAEAAARADVVFVTVPYAGMAATLQAVRDELAGKVCVCTVAPVEIVSGQAHLRKTAGGSAAEEAARAVPAARWVAALHTVPAADLLRGDRPVDTDALVCSDDDAARASTLALLETIPGLRAVDAGRLHNARHLEGATALLINLNRIHATHASLRVLGI